MKSGKDRWGIVTENPAEKEEKKQLVHRPLPGSFARSEACLGPSGTGNRGSKGEESS